MKLVTFDLSDTHIKALNEGTIDVMLVQDPFRMGYEAVKSLTEKLAGATPAKRQELLVRVIVKSDLDKPDVRALLSPEWLKGN
jgi:ribose transport system substrate-binding protein